jgi:hypothetical protein
MFNQELSRLLDTVQAFRNFFIKKGTFQARTAAQWMRKSTNFFSRIVIPDTTPLPRCRQGNQRRAVSLLVLTFGLRET